MRDMRKVSFESRSKALIMAVFEILAI